MRRIRWNAKSSPAANAGERLPKLVALFFKEGRKAADASAALDSLHRFRLKVKAARYTLEMFRPVYGPGLEDRLKRLRTLQNILGAISDYCSTLALVQDRLPEKAEVRSRLERLLRDRIRRKRAEFRRYWTQTVDAAGEEERWKRYLARPVRS